MGERPRTTQQAERALVADLVRAQATLQARTEQLEAIFASRWYRLLRFFWALRRGRFRAAAPPSLAAGESYARPLDGDTEALIRATRNDEAGTDRAAADAAPVEPAPRLAVDSRPRLLLAGHNLGFCAEVAARAARAGTAVRQNRWQRHGSHDEAASAAALEWAEAIHCEWCLGNAVWYSRNKRPGQRLVVRFHRMELETSYPGEVDLERVDTIVFVARHVLEQACERWGWDPADRRFEVVPNGIDHAAFAGRKPAEAPFTLATIGYVPELKRLDRALDVLEALRERDERYRLLVKGREPWEHSALSVREGERDFFGGLLERLERAPALRGAVDFEPFGDDVPAFLQRAGWILSTSEVEGHSVALAEGMAAGCIPAVLDRAGARDQYEDRWVHADPSAAAAAIVATAEAGRAGAESEAARSFAERWSWERLWPAWERLLLDSDRPAEPAVAP